MIRRMLIAMGTRYPAVKCIFWSLPGDFFSYTAYLLV
jgi:hypothetical protein